MVIPENIFTKAVISSLPKILYMDFWIFAVYVVPNRFICVPYFSLGFLQSSQPSKAHP